MQYRREIDGLRAVAVLPVILFHAGFNLFSGGYVGVDVFFVISGFLITSIIINDFERGAFSIAGFYERRARRILPALFVVMTACIPFAFLWMVPAQLEDFGESLGSVVLFASNILFWSEDGYFAAAAELKPLLHTWSLAVEEQFYIVFPIFLMLVWRLQKSRVFWTIVLLGALSLAFAEYSVRTAPSSSFYLAPQRAWELLAGSVCAFLTSERKLKPNELLGALGLGMIVFSVFLFDEETSFPGLNALLPVLGTALVILFSTAQTKVGRVLATPALVGIGLVSYSAYLWHQPLFAFARLRSFPEPGQGLMAGLAVVSLLLAWATWRFVEQPFRRRPKPLLANRRRVFLASGWVGAALFATGLAFDVGEGLEWRLDDKAMSLYASASSSPQRDRCHFEPESTFPAQESCVYFGESPSVAVYGNSHGVELAFGLAKQLEETGRSVVHFTVSGCGPGFERDVPAYCHNFYSSRLDYVLGQTEVTSVVLAFRVDESDETAAASVVDLANHLNAQGKKVIVVLQAPILPADISVFLRKAFNAGIVDIPSRERAGWVIDNANIYTQMANLNKDISLVDLADVFCDKYLCFAITNNSALYFDDDHMSLHGASLAAQAITQHLQ